MPSVSVRPCGAVVALTVAGLGCAGPVLAQEGSIAQLEELSEQTMSADAAIELARRQAASGELLEAAATLERILIVDENADDARLAYAAILCRLGDRQSAGLELKILRSRNVSGGAWDEVSEACGADMASRPANTRISGQISVGIAYQGDAANSFRITPDLFFPPMREDGLSFIGSARLSARKGSDAGHAYMNARFQTRNRLSGPQTDFQFGEIAAGFGAFPGDTRIAVGGVIRRGWLNDVHFVKEYGGEAEIGFRAGRSGRVAVRGEVVRQEFADNDSTGFHYDFAVSYEGRSASRLGWFVGAGVEVKDARVTTSKYFAWRVSAAMELPLDDRGSYSRATSTLRFVDFKEDPADLPRRDLRLYNRLAIGTPLGVAGLFAEGAVSYSYRDYNAASRLQDYRSMGADLRLIWQF